MKTRYNTMPPAERAKLKRTRRAEWEMLIREHVGLTGETRLLAIYGLEPEPGAAEGKAAGLRSARDITFEGKTFAQMKPAERARWKFASPASYRLAKEQHAAKQSR